MASAVVVYESVFGDAEKIARAIAEGLSRHLDVDVVAAKDAPQELGSTVRLLVVGGPNHAMSMPRPATREGAVKQYGAEIADTTTGLHEWLDAATVPSHISAAAFDTRMDHPKLVTKMDHASRTEEKLLHRLGATLAAPAEHFHVVDAKGPLADGEEDRARMWGAALAEIVTAGSRR
jgi:flavorubredoxin